MVYFCGTIATGRKQGGVLMYISWIRRKLLVFLFSVYTFRVMFCVNIAAKVATKLYHFCSQVANLAEFLNAMNIHFLLPAWWNACCTFWTSHLYWYAIFILIDIVRPFDNNHVFQPKSDNFPKIYKIYPTSFNSRVNLMDWESCEKSWFPTVYILPHTAHSCNVWLWSAPRGNWSYLELIGMGLLCLSFFLKDVLSLVRNMAKKQKK